MLATSRPSRGLLFLSYLPILQAHVVKMSSIQLLPFQRRIYEQLTAPAPDSDGLLLLARGLGMRSILCCMVETFTEDESLVVIVNATPEEEQGIAAELGQKLTIVGFEMPAKDRCVQSVTT